MPPVGISRKATELAFRKIIIANRGEIACRIIETLAKLGIKAVAVYSEADRNSVHVERADESIFIGPATPAESYLNISNIIDAAKRTGADALHPGYGFLSENHQLAAECEAHDIGFIGPRPEAIRVMASKSTAAEIARQANVPTLPGCRGSDLDRSDLLATASRIGFPVLLKSALGGGGRGMRIVNSEFEFDSKLELARSESEKAFGDDEIIIEKYMPSARHIEVQIAADQFGHCMHLWERDCSAQRRYQKIVEEAPAPSLDKAVRNRMLQSAVHLARQLDYDNIGTMEFLLQGDQFYFMEMNTRLQVEHPVTEQILGIDLVEWQIRIAAGESIESLKQPKEIGRHAVEARIYAEDPTKGFMPSPGILEVARFPSHRQDLQIHAGVREGCRISEYYDPMIAKIVATGSNRADAIDTLLKALENTYLIGVEVNVGFLIKLLRAKEFGDGAIDIGYVESNLERLLPQSLDPPDEIVAVAALIHHLKSPHGQSAVFGSTRTRINESPWRNESGWRMNSDPEFSYLLESDTSFHVTRMRHISSEIFQVDHVLRSIELAVNHYETHRISLLVDGSPYVFNYAWINGATVIFHGGSRFKLKLASLPNQVGTVEEQTGSLTAPLPGRIAQLCVSSGDHVRKGDSVVVIEAMKMEHQVRTAFDGIVAQVNFKAGDQVLEGDVCIEIDPVKDLTEDPP